MTDPPQETDPFVVLQPVQLRPTGQGGVFAVCLAHAGEVHALAINSFDRPVSLGELALSAREHMAEEHQGPPLCVCPTAPGAEPNEGCPEHGYMARRLHAAGDYDVLISRARVALGEPRGAAIAPGGPDAEEITDSLFAALTAARVALQGADTTCRVHGNWPMTEQGVHGCPLCEQAARVRAAMVALDAYKPGGVVV